ncbi:MAG: CBS domain-containing protein, partial [Candidatus Caldarchaeum sp.]|nr:CBS domain-containing protein [Candidatus Caldarchaeum sp.]
SMDRTAGDIMMTDFVSVADEEPLTRGIGIFSEKKLDVVVVKDGRTGRLVGVVTKRSVLWPNVNPSRVRAGTLAVRTPKITPNDSLTKLASAMLEKNLKALPVTEAGKPVGLAPATEVILNSRDILKNVEVQKVMTKDVITINASDTIGKAVSIMRDQGVSRLPVVDGGSLVGIVTVTDIAEKIVKPRMKASWGEVAGEKARTLSNPVRSIMTRDVVTARENEPVVEAVERMKQYGFSCLVVAERNRVTGIVTLMDALEPIARHAEERVQPISIEVSYKMDRIDVEDKKRVLEVADRFVQRFRKALGTGVLSLYFKEHREKHGDMRLVHCRARLNSDRHQFVGVGEAWRADLAARTALKTIERQFLVRKELAAKYPFGNEFLMGLAEYY